MTPGHTLKHEAARWMLSSAPGRRTYWCLRVTAAPMLPVLTVHTTQHTSYLEVFLKSPLGPANSVALLKMGGNGTISFPGVFLIGFLWFFYEHVLFSLQNLRLKFRAAVTSCCGDMLKLGRNSTISFPGAFFIGFLWFPFMNVFYLAYEIHVQNFVRLWRVVVEICWNWVEITPFHFRVRFLSDFFDFFLWTCSI